ncbi:MAG: hypothetical protein JXM74_07925 [Fusobacteriaceae bacterium]|nr:hypothetical protein [Fusobacteriaceae bacterium]
MKILITIYFMLVSLTFSMGAEFTENFENNDNDWYINKTDKEEISIEKGNYIIKNLDTEMGLSLTLSENISDFYAEEYIWRISGKENSIYGLYIELDTSDRFYFVFSNHKIASLYEKDGELGILDDFETFPFLSNDYNSIILLKESQSFTFLINQIPTDKVWTISNGQIKKIGVYVGDSLNLYIDKFSIFKL